uniref:Uncharacterized protein n=1 Tax=Hyaloperonospora arabidopsidis (strain Emoy2) TaxID=559515 RepID=M4BXA7_HYAAE
MGLPPAAEAADEEAVRGFPRAPAILGVAGFLSAATSDETPGAEAWVAWLPAARIRAAASDAALLAQRMGKLVMR